MMMAVNTRYLATDKQRAYLGRLLREAAAARISSAFDAQHLDRVTKAQASVEIDRLKTALAAHRAARFGAPRTGLMAGDLTHAWHREVVHDGGPCPDACTLRPTPEQVAAWQRKHGIQG